MAQHRSSLLPLLGLLGLVGPGCSDELVFAGSGGASSSSSAPTTSSAGPGPGSGGGASTGTAGSGAGASTTGTSATSAATGGAGPGTGGASAGGGGGASSCEDAADCVDGDPCTDDSCNDLGACEHAAKVVGSPGNPGEGPCEGVCQVDGGCGLRLFSRPLGLTPGELAWSVRPLSEVWSPGQGAPPPRGIVAVEHLISAEALLVFTGEGLAWWRLPDLGWVGPMRTPEVFPGLPPAVIATYALHFAVADANTEVTISALAEGADAPQAWIYNVRVGGKELSVTPSNGNPYEIDRTDEAGDPPPKDAPVRWSFTQQTGYPGQVGWATLWEQSGPDVYSLDGDTLVWTAYGADVESPLWEGDGDKPASGSVVAAWYEDGQIFLVAP